MERLITLKRAAEQLQVSERFLRRLERSGRLKVVRIGRAVRIREEDLERLCREGLLR
jgi:excisionase family DNA binding protein